MSFLTVLVIVAMIATVAALAFGVGSMVRNGEEGPLDSEHWMAARVLLQLTAVVALVAAVYAGT